MAAKHERKCGLTASGNCGRVGPDDVHVRRVVARTRTDGDGMNPEDEIWDVIFPLRAGLPMGIVKAEDPLEDLEHTLRFHVLQCYCERSRMNDLLKLWSGPFTTLMADSYHLRGEA